MPTLTCAKCRYLQVRVLSFTPDLEYCTYPVDAPRPFHRPQFITQEDREYLDNNFKIGRPCHFRIEKSEEEKR